MWKIPRLFSALALAILASTAPSFAQFTQVSGTVVDPNGIPYGLGTVSAVLVPSSGTPRINGQPISGTALAGLDVNGSFTFPLADNGVVTPGGTQWVLTVCESPGVAPPFGFGSVCFVTSPITITGTTQSLTTTLNALAPVLIRSVTGGGPSVLNCSTQTGSTGGAKLVACIAALPSTGGIADVTGLNGAQTGTAFTVTKDNVRVVFSPGSTWTWPAPVDSTEAVAVRANNFQLIGNGSIHQATRDIDSGTFFDYFIFRIRRFSGESTALTGFLSQGMDYRLTVTGTLSASMVAGCVQLRSDSANAPITRWGFYSNKCTVVAPDIGTNHKWYDFYGFGFDPASPNTRLIQNGIFFDNHIGSGRGLQVYNGINIRWIANNITSTVAPPLFGNVTLRAIGVDNAVFSGNVITGTEAGIYVGADATSTANESHNVTITGNTCRLNQTQASADTYCLRIIGAQDVVVSGNSFENTVTPSGTTDGIKISSVAGNTNKNISITGNRITGFLGFQIRNNDAGVVGLIAQNNDLGDSAAGGANPFGGTSVALITRRDNWFTGDNCADGTATPATCGDAANGAVIISAAATAVVVNTTAVTANSEIRLTRDNGLGTRLSVTCNTQSSLVLGTPYVSARTPGTSFTITVDVAPTTDPLCITYTIKN